MEGSFPTVGPSQDRPPPLFSRAKFPDAWANIWSEGKGEGCRGDVANVSAASLSPPVVVRARATHEYVSRAGKTLWMGENLLRFAPGF